MLVEAMVETHSFFHLLDLRELITLLKGVIGTLGVLTAAHERGLIDLIAALHSLRQTTFHVSPKLLASIAVKYRDKQ